MCSIFRNREIKIDDHVTSNGVYPKLFDEYFYNGPLPVIDITEDAPSYAGGKFVICKNGNKEVGFYINGVKRA